MFITRMNSRRNVCLTSVSRSKVTAIDLSERMLAVAKTKVIENGIKNVSLGIGDAQSLPYEDSSFDVVVDTFGLCS